MDFLRDWVISIVALVIFISLLEIFVPMKGMKKFVRVISGLMIILTLLQPFNFIRDSLNIFASEVYAFDYFMEEQNYDIEMETLQQYNEKKAVEVYKSQIANMVTDEVASAIDDDVTIHLNDKNELIGIEVFLPEDGVGVISSVATININEKKDIKDRRLEYILDESEDVKKARSILADKLKINTDQILIYRISKD